MQEYRRDFLVTIHRKIQFAEEDLGRAMTRDERAWLILRAFRNVESADEAQHILDLIYGPGDAN